MSVYGTFQPRQQRPRAFELRANSSFSWATEKLLCSSVAPWLRLISSRKARLPLDAGGELEHGVSPPQPVDSI